MESKQLTVLLSSCRDIEKPMMAKALCWAQRYKMRKLSFPYNTLIVQGATAGHSADNYCNASRALIETCPRFHEDTETGVLILNGEV